jgi:photosystem II stability/assembly factor-like uncharacterized protein
MKKILLIMIFQMFLLSQESIAGDFWLKTKGPYGAKISRISIDTSNGFIYLATKSDGVYRSTNNGQTWNSYNDNAINYDANKMWIHQSVNHIAVGPTGNLYAATDSSGIFKRLANQSSWSKKAITNNPVIYCIYILKNGDLLAGTNASAVTKSVNDGNNWSLITSGLSSITNVFSIVQANNNNILIGTDKGIYKSSDGGLNWVSVDNSVGQVNCLSKSNDGLILMAATDKGIYGSTNNGDSWNAQSSGMPQNTKVISLAYHKDGYFIAGTESNGFYFSTPSTYIWTQFNTGLETTKVRAVAVNKQGEIFAGTNFAVYKSPNTSGSWTAINTGLGQRTINRFASIANRADVLAATDLGIYKTTNSGESWMQLNQGIGEYIDISSIVIARNGNIIAGTKGDGLYYSTNSGANWIKLNDPNFTATDVTTLDSNSLGILWAGTKNQGVFKSNDITGMTWSRGNGDYIESKEILSFVVGANDVTYAGTANDGLYRKPYNEANWTKVNQGLFGVGHNTVYALAFTNTGGPNGVLYAATNIRIRRSNDNSLGSWFDAMGTLPGSAIALTACENGWVLAGVKNSKGVYIDSTTKNGDTWLNIISNSGINNYETQALAVSGRGYIFAGTKGGGCYRSEQSTSSRMLSITTNQKDTIPLQQTDKVNFILNIVDGGGNPISGATVTIKNDLGLTLNDLTTNSSGVASIEITIPSLLSDGLYTMNFKADKIGYLVSEERIVYLDVQRQRVFLEIEPKTEQFRDWDQEYKYDIITKNRDGQTLKGIKIYVDDKLKNIKKTLTSDNEGKAQYSDIVPNNHPEQTYEIAFVAEDPSAYYFNSDTASRLVTVDHNDIVINGEKNVCVNNTYTYSTDNDASKSFVWKSIVGGQFLSNTNSTTVNIKWLTPGDGEFTLEQTIISTQVKTSRTYRVTISDLPVVTLNDFNKSVCPNEPFELTGGLPEGGVYSGPGVNNGFFYGDSAGGQGTYPITYTYTSDVEPYCINSATKNITVVALPNVTLNLDSTVFCESYFPFLLTGGNPVNGTYSGPGVTNNILYPSQAGVGTHEITYSYTDEITGCTNSAKQNITINPAPVASINIPNPNICESITDYDLADKGSEAGKFSGPGVDFQTQKFNAQAAGLGTHRLVFVTDRKTGNCPGMAAIDITVVAVPSTPTISYGPTPTDTVWLESSAPSGNTWYRNGSMISIAEGRNDKRIYPEIGGNYTVTVTDANPPNCESFHSLPFSFKATAASGSFVTEASESGEIAPGKIFNISIKIGDVTDIKTKRIDSVSADMVYNASMMYPQGTTPMGTVTNHKRTIPLAIKFNPDNISQGTTLTNLEFRATIGSEESTIINFENVKTWRNGLQLQSNFGISNLEIKIKVNRNSGIPLLFGVPPGEYLLSYSIKPNPASERIKVEYTIVKGVWINIYVTNINGQILKKIYEGEAMEEVNSVEIDGNELMSGNYYVIMQTVFDKKALPLQIIK